MEQQSARFATADLCDEFGSIVQVAEPLFKDYGGSGILVNGGIRDSAEIGDVPVGAKALRVVPRRSAKEGVGDRGVPVRFAGISFAPGEYFYVAT